MTKERYLDETEKHDAFNLYIKDIENLATSELKLNKLKSLVSEFDILFIDLRFSDIAGKQHHVTLNANNISSELFSIGHSFDGSSIVGWKSIDSSDMLLLPLIETATLEPFYEEPTVAITCDVIDTETMDLYQMAPRTIAKKAAQFLSDSGIADTAYFGPEAEFFIFDSITWDMDSSGCHYKIESQEAAWNRGVKIDGGNIGHRPAMKGGYFPLPPVDGHHDIRSTMCLTLEKVGIPVELHHHEVATAGQCEIGTKFSDLLQRADWSQTFKYVVKQTAHLYGKTATFMPKPITGDNGSGMHVHQSLWKNNTNLFAGNEYANLSQLALYYIGGILKHSKALNAFANSTVNSYKRLLPGYESPTIISYAANNRSAAIRVPFTSSGNARRIEVRFPDALSNPYLLFSAMLMAGIDGVINKIDPSNPMELNLYELNKSQLSKMPLLCSSLSEAIDNLEIDRGFLECGNVFPSDFIDNFIQLKRAEIQLYNSMVHPIEFEMYYSL